PTGPLDGCRRKRRILLSPAGIAFYRSVWKDTILKHITLFYVYYCLDFLTVDSDVLIAVESF
ncbi:MAG: hypothetical protein OEW43_05670, partial [Elusimicrobiota bacterium]|nr:hypothetical protein [Elusimicrobiota bacterium]